MAPSPDGLPPHRRRAHVSLQLALRARPGRRVPAADREHRHEPRGRGVGRADPALAALARDRVGRRVDVPARRDGAREGGGARGSSTEGKAYEDEGAIRFRMPDEGTTAWDDAIKGRIEFPNDRARGLVLVRSDGRPTYNFASPVEDWLDGITHVIRGDDHVSNTPKQINDPAARSAPSRRSTRTCRASSATDGKKLSKRHGAVSVDEFREAGYVARGADELPRAARLGARRRDDDHVAATSSSSASRSSGSAPSPATFDYAKLDWMNGVYLRELPPEEYADALVAYLRERGSTGRRSGVARRSADRPGEDRAARGVPRVRGLPLPRRRAGPGAARRARSSTRRARRSAGRAVDGTRSSRSRSSSSARSSARSRAPSTCRSASP